MKHVTIALVLLLTAAGCGRHGGGSKTSSTPASGGSGGGGGGGSDGSGGSGGAAGSFAKSTTVNGVARTYALYVPSSAMTAIASGPVPLVIAFHGAGDTGSNFIAWNGLAASASSDALIVVGADGYPGNGGVRGWFLSASEGWPGTDGYSSSTANDLSFATQIKNEVGGLYNISTKRVFACGFSRGAGLTVLLAESSGNPGVLSGTWSSPFAAYGASAGYDPFGGSLSLSGTTPKRPVWMIHGTSDAAVPYSQGQSCANALIAAGFPTTFTTVSGAPHDWLWSTSYGHGNQELIDFFLANPSP